MLLDKSELVLTVDALYDSLWTLLIMVSLCKPPLNVVTASETLFVFITAFTFVILSKSTQFWPSLPQEVENIYIYSANVKHALLGNQDCKRGMQVVDLKLILY